MHPTGIINIVGSVGRFLILSALVSLAFIPQKLIAQTSYTVAYTYDAQGRLTSATYDDEWVIRYTYDANNNMTSRVIEAVGPTAAENLSGLPTEFALHASYPNPFNPTATISYDVKNAVNVRLTIFDVLGRQVATLIDEFKAPGRYSKTFNAASWSSGIYFYKVEMGDFRDVKSMLLVK